MKNFAVVGACGYIAPRHLQAINDTGNVTVAAFDPMDSVGILDKYTKNVAYFKTWEELNFHIKRTGTHLDYVSICSPNYLHRSHILASLELGADVICEKPLVIEPEDIDFLKLAEKKSGKKVYTVLQLRCHEAIKSLKDRIDQSSNSEKIEIDLTYITSRGPWYHKTWKADDKTSGGIAANIGVHFFDMLTWIYGSALDSELHYKDKSTMAGFVELEKAKVKWFLSIDMDRLPKYAKEKNQPTYRSIKIGNEEIEFSSGFTDLHTKVYQNILNGNGYGLDDAKPSIDIVTKLGTQKHSNNSINKHEFVK